MQVFVSYSHKDLKIRNLLQLRLLGQFKVFIDCKNLRTGDILSKKIESALRDSGALILIWSKNANQSDWVIRELNYFVGIKDEFTEFRTIIPMCLDDEPLPIACAGMLHVRLKGGILLDSDWIAIQQKLFDNSILI